MSDLYLTETEIDEIEQLRDYNIGDYIKNLPEPKKRLVMKQYEKESAIRQWKTIANEKY
ncbi:hypothetical protein NE686_17820 [Tissierella carlieri]|uniref:Uncharacterized protein n=1 Tax=Tissierella carlieri TaxID=689904 RepID=A0ABT1SEP2_9FIRM|nr:hypothetical protein [Tissierella carlieri]MCQ4924963.1 hypothetical protein [Tissierella carlieri]